MYPQTPNSSNSKKKSSRASGSVGDANAHRPKPFQLPTPPQTKFDPPAQSRFTFSPQFLPSPTKGSAPPIGKSNPSTSGTAGGPAANERKKGYGIDFSDDSEVEETPPKPSGKDSPSKSRGLAWVGVRNPDGHFEKVLLESAPASDQQAATWASENAFSSIRPHRILATPRRLRKPAAEKPSPPFAASSGVSGKTTSASCQTDPSRPRQANFAKPPAPYVEDVEEDDDDDNQPRSKVGPAGPTSRKSGSSQSTNTVLPSPPQTPSPPSTSTKSTQTAPIETSFPSSRTDDVATATDSEWESSSDSEFETKVSTLHSWNWRLVSRQGNFEIRSPNPSPSPKNTPDRTRRGRTTTGSPAPPPPSPMVASSLAQMKAAATVTLDIRMDGGDEEQAKKKWSPPRFAGREGDPRTSELARRLGRMGFAADKGKARQGEK